MRMHPMKRTPLLTIALITAWARPLAAGEVTRSAPAAWALSLPSLRVSGSAAPMGHLRKLIELRPFLGHVPDLSLIATEQTTPWDMSLALRGEHHAMIYTPTGRTLEINLGKIPGGTVKAASFDPRTGHTQSLGELPNQGRQSFDPPGEESPGNDWVLVLEAAAAPQ